ncbi:transposase [Paenibacillus ehimensis]|uniref:transposase n=1 Tax=Paenibacillus ehimensis TaxID=79264 RepID=UPI003D29DC78
MSKFPTANNESSGKKRSKKNRRGNKGLKSVLCQVGWASIKSKNARISAVYNWLLKRCGHMSIPLILKNGKINIEE